MNTVLLRTERKMELDQMVHQLDMVKQKHASRLQEKEAENQLHRQHQQHVHDDEIQYYQSLKELGADITQVVVSQQRNPDKLIQLVNSNDKSGTKASPNVHFVENL